MSATPRNKHITFKLWSVTTSARKGSNWCTVDAVTMGESQLRDADAAILRSFLDAAGLLDSRAISWNIDYFTTPYYSDYPAGLDWRDRLAMTWRVDIELDRPSDQLGFIEFGPIGVEAWDSTFADEEADWSRKEERCVVIGDANVEHDLSFLNRMKHELDVRNLAPISPNKNQVSIDLGILDLPSEMQKVDQIVEALKEHGVRTNWRDTLRVLDQ